MLERLRSGYLWFEDKPMVVIMAAAGATLGVLYLLASTAGWGHLVRVSERPHAWGWLGVCAAGELFAYAGYALTVRDMARVLDGATMSLARSAQTVVAGFGVFTATRSSGGFAVDYWAFRQAGAGKRDAAARAVGLGLLEYLMLSLAALIAAAALFLRLDGHANASITAPALTIIPCLALGLYLTSPRRAARLSRPAGGYLRRWFAGLVAGGSLVRRLLSSPREHGAGIVGNAGYWAGDVLCLWAALQVVHLRLSLAALVLAYTGGYVLTRRALPAGGAGVVEAALTFALYWMGLPFARSLVAVVIYRLFNFWLPILPALAFLPAIRQLRERFERAERAG
jgi:uncharacterized membrane protein YbhN (UPF0104 family)